MSSSTIEPSVVRSADLSPASWPAMLVRPVRHGIAWIEARRRLQRDARELMALDDRILRDIGLSRREIEYAARHGKGFDRYRNRVRW